MDRRTLLKCICRVAPGAAAAVLVPSSSFTQQTVSKARLIVRSTRPEDFETPAHLLTSWITPNDLFYVRSHFYTPAVDERVWRLRIDGEVQTPLELSMDDIRRLPSTTVVATLECAGNGRAFFNPRVAGVQWEKGAVGNAAWTGVRLSDVLRTAGLRQSARYLWLDGADRPLGRAPDFVRSVPIQKALETETLLAYEMNGERLPIPHGFPLRAVVPGWEGAYSIKWLTHIEASTRDHDGAFVQAGYRYPRRPVAPGSVVPVAETVPLTDLPVKSMITVPAPDAVVPLGVAIRVAGFAWSGGGEIRRVDVSTDYGRTWVPATLGRDRARYAWREFEHVWRPSEAGSYVVLARAVDSRGSVQPVVAVWNPAGYAWNAVDQVRVNVGDVTLPAEAPLPRAAADGDSEGAAVLKARCLTCHDLGLIDQQRLTADGWRREVDKMIGWGATVSDKEKDALVAYLATRR